MSFGETEQGLILVMAEGRRRSLDAGFDTRQRAFEAAKGQYEASIRHRLDGIAASQPPASGGGAFWPTAVGRCRHFREAETPPELTISLRHDKGSARAAVSAVR